MQLVVLSVLCAIVVVNTEPYVYFREEFDDGGESHSFTKAYCVTSL